MDVESGDGEVLGPYLARSDMCMTNHCAAILLQLTTIPLLQSISMQCPVPVSVPGATVHHGVYVLATVMFTLIVVCR